MDSLWSMPTTALDDESLLSLSGINSLYSNWGFISPPPTYNFSFGSKSLDLVYGDQLFLNFSSPLSNYSHPKFDPPKIYSPKPVFAYTTVHFDLARSFTPDELEYTLPKPRDASASRKRQRAVNSDVDDRLSAKRPKPDDHISGTRFAKMERLSRNPHAILPSRKLGVLSSRYRN
ncbi:hypothetical protein Clacol_006499 [Clathrus columnatus]|uniref:Uncharacterized protein n=1 Tax=Clathrus columnatus TaxID=1419009 RepID=A0AAV5AFH5_9AGAM|nr:hypothetical protein Clacol_006499 [Clathrus columnatus]